MLRRDGSTPFKFIDVVRRVLDLRGAPPETTLPPTIQQVIETRASRHWEELDENIVRWSARGVAAAVAAQFGVVAITTSAEGSPDAPRGTIFTLDHAFSETAGGVTRFGWADLTTIAVAGNATQGVKDSRNRDPLATSVPLAIVQGTQAGAVTLNDRMVLQAIGGDTDGQNELWGYTFRPTGAAGGAGRCLAFVSSVVNTAVAVRMSGRIIFPR